MLGFPKRMRLGTMVSLNRPQQVKQQAACLAAFAWWSGRSITLIRCQVPALILYTSNNQSTKINNKLWMNFIRHQHGLGRHYFQQWQMNEKCPLTLFGAPKKFNGTMSWDFDFGFLLIYLPIGSDSRAERFLKINLYLWGYLITKFLDGYWKTPKNILELYCITLKFFKVILWHSQKILYFFKKIALSKYYQFWC